LKNTYYLRRFYKKKGGKGNANDIRSRGARRKTRTPASGIGTSLPGKDRDGGLKRREKTGRGGIEERRRPKKRKARTRSCTIRGEKKLFLEGRKSMKGKVNAM